MNLTPSSPGVRRIEAPVLVDRKGTVWMPGLIDVTLRLGDRVVLAESPLPEMPPKLAQLLRDGATRFAGARSSSGAFTVSFLADPASGEQRFLGTAPGLPAAVAVVESRNELDLSALESHIARGGTLDGELPAPRGHALQVCLSALDPEAGFVPRPGVVEALRLPAGPGLRADAAVDEGEVPAKGEEIARVTAHGRTRAEALARLQRGLARTEASLRDGATDKAFLTEVLDRPELTARGPVDPGWLDALVASGEHLPRRGAEAALLGAAIAGYEADLDLARARFYASAARGRPEVPKEIGRAVELRYRRQAYLFRVSRLDRRRFRVEVDGLRLEMQADRPGRTGRAIACGERSWRIAIATQGDRQLVEVDGIPHRIERESGEVVRAPSPAVVVALALQEGDEVAAGDPVAVLEAMKLETTVLAPRSGRVRRVMARKGSHVGTGAPLLVLAPLAAEDLAAPAAGRKVRFDALVPPTDGAPDPRRKSLEEALRLMLGYDADLQTVERLVSGGSGGITGTDLPREEEILRAFADVSSLFRRPAGGGRPPQPRGVPLHLSARPRRARGGPPARLPRKAPPRPRPLRNREPRPLAGARGEPIPDLPSRNGSPGRCRRCSPSWRAGWSAPTSRPARVSRELLDRMVADTQGREPAIHDLAREVRYRVFDRPLLLAARERIDAAAASDLARLAAGPGPEEREELVRALVESTQPLHRHPVAAVRGRRPVGSPALSPPRDHGAALLPHPRAGRDRELPRRGADLRRRRLRAPGLSRPPDRHPCRVRTPRLEPSDGAPPRRRGGRRRRDRGGSLPLAAGRAPGGGSRRR